MSSIVHPLKTMNALPAMPITPLYSENNITLRINHIDCLHRSQEDDMLIAKNVLTSDVDDLPSDYLLHALHSSRQVADLNDSILNIAPSEGTSH